MPVCVWCSWKRRRSSAVAVSGERPMNAAKARTYREGFRMPSSRDLSAGGEVVVFGVRKPPRKEPAGAG
jgi:hypothetical protein